MTRVEQGPDLAPPTPAELARADVEECLRVLDAARTGLTSDEAQRRLARFGPNELLVRRGPGFLTTFASNFVHVLALLLWIASFLAFVGNLPELGWAIIAVILINGLFSAAQEFRTRRLLEALRRQVEMSANVSRDGHFATIQSSGLVPGDLIRLIEGDRVPADCRLISDVNFGVDQSSLTGESFSVPKTSVAASVSEDLAGLSNLVFSGTLVVHGEAEALVFATGKNSQFGVISLLTSSLVDTTGTLEREIDSLSRTTAVVAVISGMVIWGLSTVILGRQGSEGFVFAVGVIVALVPEGLLPTLSLSLAIGAQRMARRNVLVRRLSSIEAIGATQVICTDKTGTLTLNEMTVTRLWTPEAEFAISGAGIEPVGELSLIHGEQKADLAKSVLTAMSLASNATLQVDEAGKWKASGDPTEWAILVAAKKLGLQPSAKRVRELPFDSFRRRMSTLDQDHDGFSIHVKGAPDAVLDCSAFDSRGQPLSQDLKDAILKRADAYAGEGMRVLAVAQRHLPGVDNGDLERDLWFLGLAAMVDPIRPEAAQAIERCRGAGIRVVIITGDHPGTAAAVAREVGISTNTLNVVSGHELDQMSPGRLRSLLAKDVVFARTSPTQKLAVVSALQELGLTVAAIGDGVNDAPFLRQADIGVAMGKSGTDVAREAADILLMDDNFQTIVDAVEEGRAIFANIRKFVAYVFTSNVAELVPFAAFVLTGIPLPLTVLQILAVDLGTDLVPALALGAENPEPGVLNEQPRSHTARVLDRSVVFRAFLFLGPIEAALGLSGYFFVYWLSGWRFGDSLAASGETYALATTMTFAAIVVGQIGAVLACRSFHQSALRLPGLDNRLLLAGLFLELAVLILAGRVPPLVGTFGFEPLGWREFAFLLAILPLIPVADAAVKYAGVRRRKSSSKL